MNKLETTTLAVLGGIDAVITMVTPIILVTLWINEVNIFNGWKFYLLMGIGLLATLFRAIKIGFMK